MTKMKTVSVDEIAGKALAWAIASLRGRALREPVCATYEDVQHMKVPFTLFDVEVTYSDDGETVTAANVVPITVERCGINESVGATAPSITYRDRNRRRALASIDIFYLTQEEAEIEARACQYGGLEDFDPANDWLECGKIIDEFGVMFQAMDGGTIMAYLRKRGTSGPKGHAGDHRTAALRCLVAAECGPTVDVPADLVD